MKPQMNADKRRFGLAVVAAALVMAGCHSESPRTEAAAPAAPIAVQVVTVTSEAWPATHEVTGTVRARTTSTLSSKVMGHVREVRVQVGDRVRDGQILVVLDSRDLEAGVRQADAAREEARNAVPEADNGVAGARANLELARATFARMQDLFGRKSISNQEYDEASARLKAAEANYGMAVARRAQVMAKIAQAEEARESAAIIRGYTEIRAPFAGVITARPADPGVLATPGAPLLTIEREGAFRLEAAVEESRLSSIRTGQAVPVSLDSLRRTVAGRVAEIVATVDAASRSALVKIDLPALAGLRSGLFGRAQFALGSRQVLAIPAAAVVERGQLQSVLVVDAGFARTRLVTVGQKSKERAEVLSGLTAGEKVLFPAPAGLSDGARVEVRP